VVVGFDDPRALEALYTLYRPILDQTFGAPTFLPRPEGIGAVPLISTDLSSAELIKYPPMRFWHRISASSLDRPLG
jgi:UDPglucose 6-dehydrogenase